MYKQGSLLRTLKRDDATRILREFLSQYDSSIQHVSLIMSENFGSEDYTLRIKATLNKDARESLCMLLKLNGYAMKETRDFILIDKKINKPALLAC